MGLLDEVTRAVAGNKTTVCAVQRWLDTLDTDTRTEVDEVLATDFPAYTICRVLNKHYPGVFGERTFVRHMRGECCCVTQG